MLLNVLKIVWLLSDTFVKLVENVADYRFGIIYWVLKKTCFIIGISKFVYFVYNGFLDV